MTGKTQGLDGWQWVRLGDVAEVSFSGVDKKSVEGEVPVELCNYTDVFYNRRIQNGMEFMAATATPVECSKWALMAGDVLFTKDSETPEEIGIPSYVADDLPNVLVWLPFGFSPPIPRHSKWRISGQDPSLPVVRSGIWQNGQRSNPFRVDFGCHAHAPHPPPAPSGTESHRHRAGLHRRCHRSHRCGYCVQRATAGLLAPPTAHPRRPRMAHRMEGCA